jgi:ABC-type branched-subunit amino acid transport system substrate-binding protein
MSGSKSVRVGVAALAAVILCATPACSSSKSGPKSGGSQSSSSTSGPSGAPILIGGAGPNTTTNQTTPQPEVRDGLASSIAAINAAGGVSGHPLKLDFCDTQEATNQEQSCIRKLVADKVAVILAPLILSDQSGASYQIASKAGIPVVGTLGLSPAEFSTPGVFPMSSGIPGWAYGAIEHLVSGGAKKIALLGSSDGASVFLDQIASGALKLAGRTPAHVVNDDLSADPTWSAGAAKAIADGVDGVFVAASPNQIPPAVRALEQAGFTGKISSIMADFPAAILKALGSAANGVEVTSQVALISDTANTGVAGFLADINKYAPKTTLDEQTEGAWASAQLFAKVMASASDFSAAAILNAFSTLAAPIDVAIAGPYVVKDVKPILATFPRIFNPTVENGVIQNGTLVSDGKGLVNPFQELAAEATG